MQSLPVIKSVHFWFAFVAATSRASAFSCQKQPRNNAGGYILGVPGSAGLQTRWCRRSTSSDVTEPPVMSREMVIKCQPGSLSVIKPGNEWPQSDTAAVWFLNVAAVFWYDCAAFQPPGCLGSSLRPLSYRAGSERCGTGTARVHLLCA